MSMPTPVQVLSLYANPKCLNFLIVKPLPSLPEPHLKFSEGAVVVVVVSIYEWAHSIFLCSFMLPKVVDVIQ